jgi:hypothetical protein
MRPIRNLILGFIGLTLVTAIISAISAAILKERLISRGEETDEEIDLVTIYTGRDFTSKAPSFRGGSVLTWYGGASIDLREATLDPAGATLNARTIFGGLRILVPETWNVRTNVAAIFGGVGDARDTSEVDELGPTLTVTGFALFGGLGIMTERIEAATGEPATMDAPAMDAPATDAPATDAPEAATPAPAPA